MFLFYVDESGNTGSDLDSRDQPVHWLIAVGVTPSALNDIETEMLTTAVSYFGWQARTADFELHGSDIFSGRKEEYRRLSVDQRVQLYSDLLQLIGQHDCVLFVRGIDKQRHKERAERMGYDPDHPHRLGFMYLVERLDEWLEDQQPRTEIFGTASTTFGLVIADEQKEVDRDVVKGFAMWRMYGTDHGYRARNIKFLIDTVHYVPSQDSWLIQLADCVAFVRNRYGRIWRAKGSDKSAYTKSDEAIVRLWREYCAPHVASERVWP